MASAGRFMHWVFYGAALSAMAGAGIPLAAQQLSAPPSAAPSGAKLFGQQCGACHSQVRGETRVGPSLYAVGGRLAGTLPGFQYSAALRGSRIRWNAASLDRWLTDTGAAVPGNAMPYRQADPAKRKLIIDYLLGSTGS